MITAPLPLASPLGTGWLSMIIPRYYGLTITYISREISIEHPSVWLASLAQSPEISIEHPSVGLASLAQLEK